MREVLWLKELLAHRITCGSSGLLCRLVDSLAHLNIFAFVTVMLHHFTPVLLTHQNTRTFEV